MNIWTFLQVLGAALITALQFNIYLVLIWEWIVEEETGSIWA